MNPDAFQEILCTFLNQVDSNAFHTLKWNDNKYKIKYQTVKNEETGPIDIEIKIYVKTDS